MSGDSIIVAILVISAICYISKQIADALKWCYYYKHGGNISPDGSLPPDDEDD